MSSTLQTPNGSVSVIIPTLNGSARIGHCVGALLCQLPPRKIEIIVVDDGSTDDTTDVVKHYGGVRLLTQVNSGPAAARNHGARVAQGDIILFTDDDCIPDSNWLQAMVEPFNEPDIVAAKGAYRTRQKSLTARFVQIEYEDRYRLMSSFASIDFVDTYSAAFRRELFLQMNGYDTSFPLASAEDIELSYRMSARGWKMQFAPRAIVYHTHPDTPLRYLKKKYKFAFWRVLAVHKNPVKGFRDSHTPQLMKLQLLFLPALLFAATIDVAVRPPVSATALVLVVFLASTIPFSIRAMRKDLLVGLLAPSLLAARACAQVLGVSAGLVNFFRRSPAVSTRSSVR